MESFSEVFNIVKNILRENLTEPAYNLWIEPLQAVGLQDNVVTLLSPSAFHCSTIQHNYESRNCCHKCLLVPSSTAQE